VVWVGFAEGWAQRTSGRQAPSSGLTVTFRQLRSRKARSTGSFCTPALGHSHRRAAVRTRCDGLTVARSNRSSKEVQFRVKASEHSPARLASLYCKGRPEEPVEH
jgi:hypothetical protein